MNKGIILGMSEIDYSAYGRLVALSSHRHLCLHLAFYLARNRKWTRSGQRSSGTMWPHFGAISVLLTSVATSWSFVQWFSADPRVLWSEQQHQDVDSGAVYGRQEVGEDRQPLQTDKDRRTARNVDWTLRCGAQMPETILPRETGVYSMPIEQCWRFLSS